MNNINKKTKQIFDSIMDNFVFFPRKMERKNQQQQNITKYHSTYVTYKINKNNIQ